MDIVDDSYSNIIGIRNKTVCIASEKANRTVRTILSSLPTESTHYLDILVNNTRLNRFPPGKRLPINVTSISQLTLLEGFELRQCYSSFLQQYDLQFDIGTFLPLTKLRYVMFDLALGDQSYHPIFAPLCSLEILSLWIRGSGISQMTALLSNLHHKAVKRLKVLEIPTFQLINNNDYANKTNVTDLTNNSYFKELEVFSLSDNSITTLISGFTHNMPNLRHIDLSNNILLGKQIIPILYELLFNPKLTTIGLEMQGFIGGNPTSSLERKHDRYREKRYTNLYIESPDGTEDLQMQIFKRISYYFNHISMVYSGAKNISFIFSKNNITTHLMPCIVPSIVPKSHIYFPDLRNIYNMDCSFFVAIPVGKEIQKISASNVHLEKSNVYGSPFGGRFCVESDNMLKDLNVSNNAKWLPSVRIEDSINSLTSINGLDKLEMLDLSNNNVSVKASLFVSNLPRLKELHFAGNRLAFYDTESLCARNSELEYLSLSNNGMTCAIPNMYFSTCSNLVQLDLSTNLLEGLCFHVTGSTIKFIDLSNNKVEFLSTTTISNLNNLHHSNEKPLTINLFGNPLACDCRKEALSFIEWVIKPPIGITFLDIDQYTCTSPTGVVGISSITASQVGRWNRQCNPNNLREALAITFSCIAAGSSVLLISILYRKRWLMKYKYFSLNKRMFSDSKKISTQHEYDAFIAYCAEDRFWVHEVLMKTLENYYGFKLCIHYRDFPVGSLIQETIIEFMSNSRELILVVSDFFLSSEWCQFELEEALWQANLRESRLIVIKMGNPNLEHHLTAMHVITCHVYLEWDDSPQDRVSLFWAKLVGRMYSDDTGKNSFCCCNYGARALGYE